MDSIFNYFFSSKATIIPISQLKNHIQTGMKRSSPKSAESPVRIEVQNLSSDESSPGKRIPIRNYIKPTEPDPEVSPSIVQVQKPQLEDLINNKDTEPRRVRNNKEYDNYSPMGVKPGPKPSIGRVVIRLKKILGVDNTRNCPKN